MGSSCPICPVSVHYVGSSFSSSGEVKYRPLPRGSSTPVSMLDRLGNEGRYIVPTLSRHHGKCMLSLRLG